ncbi:MAG: LutB/LldF family L-lactate oxidation iron-sulfur protein [Desulfomonilaceae bacterium]
MPKQNTPPSAMTVGKRAESFRARACLALDDPVMREALLKATRTALAKRQETLGTVDFQRLRQHARSIRLSVLDRLPQYVRVFASEAKGRGAHVHECDTCEAANQTILKILHRYDATRVVKSKSMVTEEMGLYECLKEACFEVVETDLGEYIVSLAGERPSHITAPAIHKTRSQVGKLFHEVLGAPYSDDPHELAAVARQRLRLAFLEAQAGITGANFALGDSGGIVLFTNEGNGRMCTVLPPLHIAVISPEKIIPSIEDLDVFMKLLPASATGQTLTTYLSIITGGRSDPEAAADGAMHIVIVDNGRSNIAQSDYRDILTCIRCGACMNVCPVYTSVGGHAYNSTYVGPMGIVLSILLFGMEAHHELTEACTLCGACDEVCPVAIPLSRLIGRLRRERIHLGLIPASDRIGMKFLGRAFGFPMAYRFSQQAVTSLLNRAALRRSLPAIFHRLPKGRGVPFHRRFRHEK